MGHHFHFLVSCKSPTFRFPEVVRLILELSNKQKFMHTRLLPYSHNFTKNNNPYVTQFIRKIDKKFINILISQAYNYDDTKHKSTPNTKILDEKNSTKSNFISTEKKKINTKKRIIMYFQIHGANNFQLRTHLNY